MSGDRRGSWQPPAYPEWVARINAEGEGMDLATLVPLGADELIATACHATGLVDFGDNDWNEPFRVLCAAIEAEAELSLTGRLMARSDLLVFLQNRLRIEDWHRRHPEIAQEPVREPLFIVGLPRSGTSILFELLACDPAFAVPETWMAQSSCPPPAVSSPENIAARVARAHHLVTQWARVLPAFASMHEMGGRIPAECGMLMASCFRSDHFAALHQTPSYDAFLARCNWDASYRCHRRVLQLLQWRAPPRRWLLKAPNHLGHLPELFAAYPDARVVQTHRDPLKCMASATDLLGSLYRMRSAKPFDSTAFEDVIRGAATATRLDNVTRLRDRGELPADRIVDSRYQDLIDDPRGAMRDLYLRLGMELTRPVEQAMQAYLAHKPQGKFGVHRYAADDAQRQHSERALFHGYQQRYGVADEP